MDTSSNKRIVKNTMFLYIRMLLVLGVSLYTSRVILKALGFADYGLYNVIGGFVGLFSIISASLSAAISRFLTYELGTTTQERLESIFSCSKVIQLILCVVVIILCGTFGVWFVRYKMQIPDGQYISALVVFGFSVVSFCLNLLSVPYNAILIAHEKMQIFAGISIIEVLLKLIISYAITLFNSDRLIIYAFLLFVVSATIRLIYIIYTKRNFCECNGKLIFEKSLFKEISKFAGWNFIGSSAAVLKTQGLNVLLNVFFGPVVNAAYAISMQVGIAVSQLNSNFMTAVRPQITKLYASGRLTEMFKLVTRSSKLSFFLCWLLSQIILLNTSYILHLWLGNSPTWTIQFVNLILLCMLSDSLSDSLTTTSLATGVIRNYQLIVGGIQLMNLPISFLALKMGQPPTSVMVVSLVLSQLCLLSRLVLLNRQIKFGICTFVKDVYLRCVIMAIVSMILPLLVKKFIPYETFGAFVLQSLSCLVSSIVFICLIGLNNEERKFMWGYAISLTQKLR